MMSSATSTSEVRLKPYTTAAARVQTEASSFRASHFFVLASLVAATAAVIMSRQATPEHLVLISLTIASAGLAAAGFYRMMSPLVGEASAIASEALSERTRAVLAREKALVLRAMKDLEFDRSMGKVSQTDFEEMAARLRTRALTLMKQLDEDGSGYRTIIERELSARLAARSAAVRLGALPADLEPAPVVPVSIPGSLSASGPESTSDVFCSCGTANDTDALFCKRCGTKLVPGDAAPTSR
jgi:hypothetical protein